MGVVERLVESEHYVVDQLAALRLSRHIGVVRMVRPQKRAVAAEGASQQERAVRLGEGRRLVRENLMVNAGELGTLLVRSVESLSEVSYGLEIFAYIFVRFYGLSRRKFCHRIEN